MVRTQTADGQKRARRRSNSVDVARELVDLSVLNTKTLKQRWQSLYGTGPPPGLGRALLVRVLAYRIQERAFGALKPATRRFLIACADTTDARRLPPAPSSRAATAGTVLVREWHGTSHRVTVLDKGCTWRGKRYRSLSEVARAITGTRWSGPRFFGLGHTREERRNGTHEA
jgi:hypothetical protein